MSCRSILAVAVPNQLFQRRALGIVGAAMAVSPDFATRKEAATRLNLSPRQIDRLCAAGILHKVKSSANRAGILRESLEGYVDSRKGGRAVGAENQDTMGTKITLLVVELPGVHLDAARAIDRYL